MRGYLAAFIGTVLGCLAIAITTVPGLQPSAWLANRWAKELPDLPDDEIQGRLEQIAELGDAGVGILVDCLASDRQVLADASEKTIREQISRWRLLTRHQSSNKVASLAEHLARKADELSARRRAVAADIAMQILLWPIENDRVDSGQLIANCERVLRGAASESGSVVALVDKSNGPGHRPSDGRLTQSSGVPRMSLSDTHSSGLPAAIVDIPSLPVANAEEPQDTSSNPDDFSSSRSTLAGDDVSPMSLENLQRLADNSSAKPMEVHPPSASELLRMESSPEPPNERNATERLETLDHVTVMRYLRAADEPTSVAASTELERRGFTENDLYLALQLTDPDPRKRVELARLLPRLSGVDSRRWLFWLSEDEDAAVRAESVSILVTIQDPDVQKYLKRIAERETSPSVLQHFR